MTLQALRQPLESGRVVLARSRGTTEYPAQAQLILAANPCPCATTDQRCTCSPQTRRRYLGRLSGPLLDRVDIKIDLLPMRAAQLMTAGGPSESSVAVAARVLRARTAAMERWRTDGGWRVNSEVPGPQLRQRPWLLPATDTSALRAALDRGTVSARGFDRVLRLAWTIADLDGRNRPGGDDVAEALQLRTGSAGPAPMVSAHRPRAASVTHSDGHEDSVDPLAEELGVPR